MYEYEVVEMEDMPIWEDDVEMFGTVEEFGVKWEGLVGRLALYTDGSANVCFDILPRKKTVDEIKELLSWAIYDNLIPDKVLNLEW